MNLLNSISLNQLADYVFIGGTVLGFVLFIALMGVVGQVGRDIRKSRKESKLTNELLLSQIKVLKQIRDGRYR